MISLPKLQQGIYLGRHNLYSVDVAMPNGAIQTIQCSLTGSLGNCAVLGATIWLSESRDLLNNAHRHWELAEVEGGYLTCVNMDRIRDVCLEGIANNAIPTFPAGHLVKLHHTKELDAFLLTDDPHPIAIGIHPVLLGDEIHRGFFPDSANSALSTKLKDLIKMRHQECRSVLWLAVGNNCIHRTFLVNHLDAQLGQLVHDAIDRGVEIFAHRIDVSLDHLTLGSPIPFHVLPYTKA